MKKIETEAKIGLTEEEFIKIKRKLERLNGYDAYFQSQENIFYSDGKNQVRLREQKTEVSDYRNEKDYVYRYFLNRKSNKRKGFKYKSMDEDEIEIEDKKQAEKILVFMGFKKFFSYQKQRADFEINGCVVSLDILPRNKCFLEIEGDEENISQVISRLGLQDFPVEKRSYLEILTKGDMY